MKKLIAFLLIVFVLLFSLNFFPVLKVRLGLTSLINVYSYVDRQGERLVEVPEKGRPLDYDICDCYRTFRREYYKVWNWVDYATHPRWKVPYKSPSKVLMESQQLQDQQQE